MSPTLSDALQSIQRVAKMCDTVRNKHFWKTLAHNPHTSNWRFITSANRGAGKSTKARLLQPTVQRSFGLHWSNAIDTVTKQSLEGMSSCCDHLTIDVSSAYERPLHLAVFLFHCFALHQVHLPTSLCPIPQAATLVLVGLEDPLLRYFFRAPHEVLRMESQVLGSFDCRLLEDHYSNAIRGAHLLHQLHSICTNNINALESFNRMLRSSSKHKKASQRSTADEFKAFFQHIEQEWLSPRDGIAQRVRTNCVLMRIFLSEFGLLMDRPQAFEGSTMVAARVYARQAMLFASYCSVEEAIRVKGTRTLHREVYTRVLKEKALPFVFISQREDNRMVLWKWHHETDELVVDETACRNFGLLHETDKSW